MPELTETVEKSLTQLENLEFTEVQGEEKIKDFPEKYNDNLSVIGAVFLEILGKLTELKENDLGFIGNTVDNLVNYYKKSETMTSAEISKAIADEIAKIETGSTKFVEMEELPEGEIENTIILIKSKDARTKNKFDEYKWIESEGVGEWEMIGGATITIDLSSYYTKTESDVITNEIKTTVTDLSTALESVKTRVTALEQAEPSEPSEPGESVDSEELATLKNQVAEIETQLGTISSDLTGLGVTVTTQGTELSSISSSVTALQSTLDEITAQVGALETSLTDKASQSDLTTLNTIVSTAETTLATKITSEEAQELIDTALSGFEGGSSGSVTFDETMKQNTDGTFGVDTSIVAKGDQGESSYEAWLNSGGNGTELYFATEFLPMTWDKMTDTMKNEISLTWAKLSAEEKAEVLSGFAITGQELSEDDKSLVASLTAALLEKADKFKVLNEVATVKTTDMIRLEQDGVEVKVPTLLFAEKILELSVMPQYKPEGFGGYTLAEISYIGSIGLANQYFEIGDNVDITLSTGEVANFSIIGFYHDEKTSGGSASITFQMTNMLSTKRAVNSTNTNAGSFVGSELYAWLNGDFFESLPQDWQDVIVQVNKNTSAGNLVSTIRTDSMTVFLPSEIEIFGVVSNSYAGEGNQYPYYATLANRIKRYNNSVHAWRIRSPGSASSLQFRLVSSSGLSVAGNASVAYGIAPCFSI